MDDAILADLNEDRFRPRPASEARRRRSAGPADPGPIRLSLFVVFSSVTTVLGNPAQANYVAANAAAEAVVERRHREGLPGLGRAVGPDCAMPATWPAKPASPSCCRAGWAASSPPRPKRLSALARCSWHPGAPVVGPGRRPLEHAGCQPASAAVQPVRGAAWRRAAEPAAEVDLRELLENSTPEDGAGQAERAALRKRSPAS